MSDKKPKFTHDCDNCKFLGQAKYKNKLCDWYVCDGGAINGRSIIARYGDDGPEYASSPLVSCVDLTPLEKKAIALGFELTDAEKEKALKILLKKERQSLSLNKFRELLPSEEEMFALGKDDLYGFED